MRRIAVLLPLLFVAAAAGEPTLHVQYPQDSFYDEDGTPLVPLAPGNAHSLEVLVTDGGEPVKNARVRFANQATGAVDTAWTNAAGVAARGQYAGGGEAWWDVEVSIDCVLDADTGDCVDATDPAQRVRLAWTRIQVVLEGPATAKTGGSATLRASAVWTVLGTAVPEGRVHVTGDGASAHAYIVDGQAVVLHSRPEPGSVGFVATMDPDDRPAAVPVLESAVLYVEFRDDAPQQPPGEPTDDPEPAPRPGDEGTQDASTDSSTDTDADASQDDSSDDASDDGTPSSGGTTTGDDAGAGGDGAGTGSGAGTEDTGDGGKAQSTPGSHPLLILGAVVGVGLLRRRS